METCDSYSIENKDRGMLLDDTGGQERMCQSFTGNGGTLEAVWFYLSSTGSPSGYMYCYIYAHSGTFGTSSIPTGAPLATSDALDSSTLSGEDQPAKFTFSGNEKIGLEDGTYYVAGIYYADGNYDTDYFEVSADSDGEHAGNYSYYLDSWTPVSAYDMCFRVYVDSPVEGRSYPLPPFRN